MDTQGRKNIDPADQWVLDPDTGSYQLRLEPEPEPESETETEPTASRVPAQSGGDGRRRQKPGSRRAAPPEAAAGSRRKRKPKSSKKKKALTWTAGTVGLLLVAGSVAGYVLFQELNGNIAKVDIGDIGNKSATVDGPLNILIIGTDSREGLGKQYGDVGSVGHADTTILFHVSEDRTNATALSIPRDMITAIPDCPTKQEDGSTKIVPGTPRGISTPRFNESLGQSGRDQGCTMRTVEDITGIMPDHFMQVDFNAVKTISTAVGGVPICLNKAINDEKSKLDLGAGDHKVMGEDALAFVRTRHSVGFESDLDRIKLQQQFLGSMIRQVKSSDTLTSPSKLFKLASAATEALTVDNGIGSAKKLTTLAQELAKVELKNISFVTVPVLDNPDERVKATVVLDESKGPDLFSMIEEDISLTEVEQKKNEKKDKDKEAQDKKLEGPKADASEVRVAVFNGSGVTGAAQDVINWMQNKQGMPLSSNGGNGSDTKKTVLEYAPDQADQARRLADLMGLPATALKEGTAASEDKEPMTLTLGDDFKAAGTSLTTPTEPPKDLNEVGADEKLCAG